MWKFELRRILINKKGLIIIFFGLLFECISMLSTASFRCENIIENNKEMYKNYLSIYGGKVSQKKSAALDKEIERLEQNQQAASDITDAYLKGEASAAEVSAATAQAYPYQMNIKILKQLRQQMNYVMKTSGADTIIYENGWLMLLGKSHINYVIPVLLIFLFLPSVTENFECGMHNIIYCCKKGKSKLYIDKMAAMLIISFFICIANASLEVMYIQWNYGLNDWMTPIKNISAFQKLPFNLPLIFHLIIKMLQWGVACIFLCCLILVVGLMIQNSFNGILFLLILIIAPAIFLEKEVVFKFFQPISFFIDGGWLNGVETLQDSLMAISKKNLLKIILYVFIILIFCLGISRFLINKKRNIRVLGIFLCSFFLFGCQKISVNQDEVYVANMQADRVEVNGYYIFYDTELMDYVIEKDEQKILLNNDPLQKIVERSSNIFDFLVYRDMLYYAINVSMGGEFWYEIYELNTNTMKKEVIYTTKLEEGFFSMINQKLNNRMYLQFQLLLATNEIIVYSDTQGVYLYDRESKTEKNILSYAYYMGIYKGDLYYIDRIGYLNVYCPETGETRKVMDEIISGYVFAKGGIIYLDKLDLKVKLYKDGESTILFEEEVQCIFLKDGKVKCLTYEEKEIVID